MVSDNDTDETFDEDELAEGFLEEIVGEEDLEDAVDVDVDVEDEVEVDDVEDLEGDEAVPEVVVIEEDDIVDDADIELALDEVLAETIRRTSTPEDDDEIVGDVDPTLELTEVILPKQDDEFLCNSCRLLKKTSQLADKDKNLCRDCV